MQIFLAFLLLLSATSAPKSVTLVPGPYKIPGDSHIIGNVGITFTDGHKELWTKEGKAMLPKISESGLVGWVKFDALAKYGPYCDTVRVCWPDEHHKDFKAAGPYIYIEDWAFADKDHTLIIKSRGAHGPAAFIRYDLATGKTIGNYVTGFGKELPAWAQPFSD